MPGAEASEVVFVATEGLRASVEFQLEGAVVVPDYLPGDFVRVACHFDLAGWLNAGRKCRKSSNGYRIVT